MWSSMFIKNVLCIQLSLRQKVLAFGQWEVFSDEKLKADWSCLTTNFWLDQWEEFSDENLKAYWSGLTTNFWLDQWEEFSDEKLKADRPCLTTDKRMFGLTNHKNSQMRRTHKRTFGLTNERSSKKLKADWSCLTTIKRIFGLTNERSSQMRSWKLIGPAWQRTNEFFTWLMIRVLSG